MNFPEYQKQATKTVVYPVIGHGVVYPTLGLSGEAAEVANKVKKIFRDDDGKITEKKRAEIKGELGDVLWCLSQVATELDLNLEEIAQENLEKLASRKARGKLRGDGDSR